MIDPKGSLALKAKELDAKLTWVGKDLDSVWNSKTLQDEGLYIAPSCSTGPGDFVCEMTLRYSLSHLPKRVYNRATYEAILNGITLNIWNFVHNDDATSVKCLDSRVIEYYDSYVYITVVYSSDQDYGF